MHREDFKILNEESNSFTYLDNASTSLTPEVVIESMSDYYSNYKSNIDRGLYKSAVKATDKYEEARRVIAKFIGCESQELIFNSGATDSANKLIIMLESYFANIHKNKNEILVLSSAHHSDLIPLQEYVKRNKGADQELKLIVCSDTEDMLSKLNANTLLASVMLASNVTGEIFDVKRISIRAAELSAILISDLTAYVGHADLDVKELNISAGYFSAHKMCGPTGVGALYIKKELLSSMQPATFGGGMVYEVEEQSSSYRGDVKRYEAGTPNIGGVIGFAAAANYLSDIGVGNIKVAVEEVLNYALEKLNELEKAGKLRIYAERDVSKNIGIISFEVYKNKGSSSGSITNVIHPHDVAQVLADVGVAVRSGHHCAKLLMDKLCVPALTRASFYFYNTKEDVDALINSIEKAIKIFSR